MAKSVSIGLAHRKGPAPTHTDAQYLAFDPLVCAVSLDRLALSLKPQTAFLLGIG